MPEPANRACLVLGAGLAGSAVASQLARRGWQVQVLDAAAAPARGASGLPVGLVVPHLSPDDNLLSRATRAGVSAMWTEAHALLRAGEDYAVSGVRERLFTHDAQPQGERWHAQAGWIKPPALITAWLQHPGIEWQPDSHAARIAHQDGRWAVFDGAGRCLGAQPHLVLCAGFGTLALLPRALPLQALRGQLTWDVHRSADASEPALDGPPANGSGNFITRVPTDAGPAWFLGSSFVRDDLGTDVRCADHLANLARLQRLSPPAALALQERIESGRAQAFCATRCAARDRMPVVGPVPGASAPGLWMSTAMGARGLSLALLCAQMLAAHMDGDNFELEPAVQRALQSTRKALTRALHRTR